MSNTMLICLLGFGEVGQTLAADLSGKNVTAWDLRFADAQSEPSRALRAQGLTAPTSAAEAVRESGLVISAVTAAQDRAAAESVLAGLRPGTFFMDLNSVSPEMKRETAAVIEAASGRYVEAAVLSPIGPKRIASPMLLGGPHAAAFLPLAQDLGFTGATVLSETIGQASATKMCRSVIIKGMEALMTESLLVARYYGVEAGVLGSLSDLFPGHDWPKLAMYLISRGLQHGTRRAEEMREVAETVAQAGIEPLMSLACAARQDWSARYAMALQCRSLEDMLDAVRREAVAA